VIFASTAVEPLEQQTRLAEGLDLKKEVLAFLKIFVSNIGILKEIFFRPQPKEILTTILSFANAITSFCKNVFRSAAETLDMEVKEQIMVGLQALLHHSIELRLTITSKACAYPIFTVDSSLLSIVRSISSMISVVIDAVVEWDKKKTLEDSVFDITPFLHLPTYQILAYGRLLATPRQSTAVAAGEGKRYNPLEELAEADPNLPRLPYITKSQAKELFSVKGEMAKQDENDGKSPEVVPENAKNKNEPMTMAELGPPPPLDDSTAYKAYMVKKYEIQQRENAEILRKKKLNKLH